MIDRRAGVLVAVLLPGLALAVVPHVPGPFSTPKTWLLLAGAVLALGLLVRRRFDAPRGPVALAAAWAACAAIGTFTGGAAAPMALLRILAAAILLVALLAAPPNPGTVLRAAAVAGSAVALVVLLQAVGLDPFRAFGLVPAVGGARMHLYGTLGNPDFDAGFLAATACATGGELAAGRRRWLWAGLGVQIAALGLLGSFATLLSVAGAALALAASKRVRRAALAVAAVALVMAGIGVRSRSPGRALAGRLYLWSVAAPHVEGAPLFGHGAGSFVALWPGWEAARWRAHPDPADRAFAGAENHAHGDWLEALLDTGVLGFLTLAALLGLCLARGVRFGRTDPRRLAAAAGLAAVIARSLVDFPLERPAELGLAMILAALAAAPFPLEEENEACLGALEPSHAT